MKKTDILSYNEQELEKFVVMIGEKKFRSKQIFDWLHNKNVREFSEMKNISKQTIEKLQELTYIPKLNIDSKLESKEDGTVKYLFELKDGNYIESVFMKYKHGNAVCVSTQVGCKMGCTFCASTVNGFVRNLTAGEMLGQIYEIQKDTGERVSNIVLMGSGEPLDNLEEVLKFIENINSESGLNISQRSITLSTCGLIDKIYELEEKKLKINLAVSLHATNQTTREQIMPIAITNPLEELLKACKHYGDVTKRRVTFEYALIHGVNDSVMQANELGRKIKGSLSHVNLIPVNKVTENNYEKSNNRAIKDFANILKSMGIEVTIRRELGSDINAACGQLRNSKVQNRG